MEEKDVKNDENQKKEIEERFEAESKNPNQEAIIDKKDTGQTPKNTHSNKKLWFVIILLFLIILGLAGYIGYNAYVQKIESNKEQTVKENKNKESETLEQTKPEKLLTGTRIQEAKECYSPEEREGFMYTGNGCSGYGDGFLYTKSGDGIVENLKEQYISLYNNYAYIYKDGKIMKVSPDADIINSVEKSDVVHLFNDVAVIIENNQIVLYFIETKKSVTLGTTMNNYTYSIYGSGYYEKTIDGLKPGYYVVFEDSVTPYEQFEKDADGNVLNAYEYYYIPETGEIGKIKTFIGGYAKPVLYLYPKENNTKVIVEFEKPQLLTTTYPKFISKWSVKANKNGDLYDQNGKYYYGLYWEENGSTPVDFTEGFYVTKETAIEFLEEKLDIIGLNKKERNEFIMYWLPILEKNEKNLVYFELTNERQAYNKLNITPKPDSLLRVAIHVKKVSKETNIKEQKLKTFERKGFTAVEWGGVIH